MEALIPVGISLIQSLIPSLPTASAGVIAGVIQALTVWTPLVIKEYKALKPVVLDAIDAIENNTASTVDQVKALRALVAADDAEFDAALAKSRAED